jgi:hypothetical protein
MAQNFLPCDRDQELLLPPSLREWLPEECGRAAARRSLRRETQNGIAS